MHFLVGNVTCWGAIAAADAEAAAQGPQAGGAITDVAGIKVGHFTDTRRPTGCTAVIAEEGAVGGVDVRGSAPATRETDLLAPINLVERVHAVMLSGGSAFGLDAAGGAMHWLESHGIGFQFGTARVPIVPAASLFDLRVGDPKIRPDANAGFKACDAASTTPPAQGNIGAGAGATVGKFFGMERAMKSGIGTASIRAAGVTVGALFAVNATGDVVDPATGRILAGARTPDGRALYDTTAAFLRGDVPQDVVLEPGSGRTATTIGVVATDATLTKTQATKVAQMAHDGLARAIRPAHTLVDGDTIFVLGTGHAKQSASTTLLGILAAEATARAIVAAVQAAVGLPGLPAVRNLGVP
ncbi:MAG: P1 family peptidase [Candidatus Eremiobacteraeota bacterium]|nr:P1 family peptidase [Candidatus Eremiobacteraeota bacterium]